MVISLVTSLLKDLWLTILLVLVAEFIGNILHSETWLP